jgi:S-adenosylmethionine/arginine decarboxylase-like enzyme
MDTDWIQAATNNDTFRIVNSQAVQESLQQQGIMAKVDFLVGPRFDSKPFGTTLALDFYDCSLRPLESIEIGYQFLEKIVSHLGMTMQSPPFIFLSDAQRFPDKAGLSGWVPLIESGITLHTLIPTRFATIDIYSCSDIPPVETIAFAYRIFLPQRIEATYFYRGRNYPLSQANNTGGISGELPHSVASSNTRISQRGREKK